MGLRFVNLNFVKAEYMLQSTEIAITLQQKKK